jgi:GNAT superfamily N-acetyltransferase
VIEIRSYEPGDLPAIRGLLDETGEFDSLRSESDAALARALAGTGVVTLVADDDGALAGFARTLTDGVLQAYLCHLLVAPAARGQGLGRRLTAESLTRSGAVRIDLLTSDAGEPVYATLPHMRVPGFRIFSPEDPRFGAHNPGAAPPAAEELAICATCGTQFDRVAPSECPICRDPRQYVPAGGQAWTTLAELRGAHHNRLAPQGELTGIASVPRVAIGQRALLVPDGAGSNLMWDCVTLFDLDTAAAIERRGGLSGIAISHPHYYAGMVEWARHFDCPIHLHAADREWIMRPDPRIELWDGETEELGNGLTLVNTGGHFEGATVLHWAGGHGGEGTLLMGDICGVVPDGRYVTFLWSYPNLVPLPARAIERIGAALAPFRYRNLHAAFWDTEVDDAEAVIDRSIHRFVDAVS